MYREQEEEILARIERVKNSEQTLTIIALLESRFEQYRDKLVTINDEAIRGRAKEVKDLIELLR